jgi:hypothetical protein
MRNRLLTFAGLMLALALAGAGPAPKTSKIKLSAKPACETAVEGKRCPIAVSVKNASKDILLLDAVSTDREADRAAAFLRSEYGSLGEDESGRVVFNQMAQQATGPVFFGRKAVVLPGGKTTVSITSRLLGGARTLIVRFYRIPKAKLKQFLYGPQKSADMGGSTAFSPVKSMKGLKALEGGILWNGGKLQPETASVTINPAVTDAPFSLASAKAKLPAGATVKEISFSDTFAAWLFFVKDGTWMVASGSSEKLGVASAAVFEAIDEKEGKNVSFRIEKDYWGGKLEVEPGDGMYTQGLFVSASGGGILTVLRTFKKEGRPCTLFHYFFESWYLDCAGGP